MELNIFNINLNVDNKSREDISEFAKELSNYLEKKESEEISILDRLQNSQKITVMYRDKMNLERNKILNNYARENSQKGSMYYIYSKDNSIYNLCICEEDKSNVVLEVKEVDLPRGATVDSVLRKENGKYVLDFRATMEIQIKLKEMITKLLNEQTNYLKSQRIEGDIYEVGEIEKDRVWLYNISKYNSNEVEAFEEINFPLELLSKLKEGIKVKYQNGNYSVDI